MELNDYLLTTLTQTNFQVTFSGDRPNLINKFLVKGSIRNESNSNSKEPYVNNGICFTMPTLTEGVSNEELESNWRYYWINSSDQILKEIFDSDTDQYIYSLSCIYCNTEKDAVIDIWNINPIRIWINGRLVMATGISYNIRHVVLAFKFQKGLNTLLIERMKFTANHEKLGIVDLVSYVSYMPMEFLTSSEYIDLFDVGLFEELKNYYIIIPEKSLFKDRRVKFIVFPKWFDTPDKEKVRIEMKSSQGKSLRTFETFTEEQIEQDMDEDINGVLIIKAVGLDNHKQSFDTHIFRGNFVKERNSLIKKGESILGTENNILKSFKQLVKIPDLCNKLGEMIQEELYERMLKSYSEFENAILFDNNIKNKDLFDIYDNNMIVFNESEIDGEYLSYGVNLPKNFRKEKTYPLILIWQWGYAFSAIPRTPRYIRRREFDEAVIVTMCARGEFSSDYINEINILNIINSLIEDFKIDRDQIIVLGHCSSSTTVFTRAVRKPDLFSGIGNITGLPGEEDIICFRNIENLNLYNLFCFKDLNNIALIASIQQSEHFKKIKNNFYNYYVHTEMNEFFNSRGLIKALLKEKKEKYPKKLWFTTKAPIYNKSYWIYIDIIENLNNNAEIEAEIQNESKIIISTCNIKRFSLLLGQKEMNLNKNIEILLNSISYKLEIENYLNISFDVQTSGVDLKLQLPDYLEFQRLYNSISIKEELLGLKQVYLEKSIILKPDNFIDDEDYGILLFDILKKPLKGRIRNYKYEMLNEGIIDEKKLSESNFVMYINPLNISSLKEKILKFTGIELDQAKIIYDNKRFEGNFFAIIKKKNPFNADKLALLAICNSKGAGEEMIRFLKTFDDNPLFFSDAVIYSNGEYHSIRAGI
jgi:hypothetical protein